MKLKYIIIAYSSFLLLSCSGGNAPEPPKPPANEGYEAPEPPKEINSYNLFTVDFFSKLSDEKLFDTNSYDAVINYIESNKSSLFFFFDRADITIGELSPVVDIAVKTKNVPFFVQNKIADNSVEGTGIITRQLVNVYPGIFIKDSLFAGGCNVSVPLYQTTRMSLVNCRISEEFQFELIAKRAIPNTETNKIIIGTISGELENAFREYLKYNLQNFRISITDSGKKYKLFVLSPVGMVVRELTETAVGSFPVYQCKIEKIAD